MRFSDLAKNLLTTTLSLFLVFGGLELGTPLFLHKKIQTYFDEQAERALGYPVPRKSPAELFPHHAGGSTKS